MTNVEIIRTTPTPRPRQIDYARMREVWPQQRADLEAALATGDPVEVAKVCVDAVAVWDEIGAWPDDWAAFQRALDDVLPWNQQVQLDDVAYGRVVIRNRGEER